MARKTFITEENYLFNQIITFLNNIYFVFSGGIVPALLSLLTKLYHTQSKVYMVEDKKVLLDDNTKIKIKIYYVTCQNYPDFAYSEG